MLVFWSPRANRDLDWRVRFTFTRSGGNRAILIIRVLPRQSAYR